MCFAYAVDSDNNQICFHYLAITFRAEYQKFLSIFHIRFWHHLHVQNFLDFFPLVYYLSRLIIYEALVPLFLWFICFTVWLVAHSFTSIVFFWQFVIGELHKNMIICYKCFLMNHFHLVWCYYLHFSRNWRRQKQEVGLCKCIIDFRVLVTNTKHCWNMIGTFNVN